MILNLKEDVAVEDLFKELYKLYMKELKDLQMGKPFNKVNIAKMMNIVNGIYYLEHTDTNVNNALNLIERYIQ